MPIQRYWFNDGPLLPIEFACHSTKDRITAVIVPGVRRVRSLWAIMTVNDVDAARKTGGSAHHTAGQPRGRCESAHRAVSRPCEVPRLAPCASPLLGKQRLQSRLPG